jgi:hypothetical protein
MMNPPLTGISELDAYLYDLHVNGFDNTASGYSANTATGEITDSEGNVVGYLYEFIHIKYADDTVGTNMSDTPTNKLYYGIHNSSSFTESTNPADYTWYFVNFGFGTTRFLYYQNIGGRLIKFDVNTDPIDYKWLPAPTTAISLDLLIAPRTISSSELMDAAVTELKIAANAVTATKLNVAALDQSTGALVPNAVSAGTIASNAVTELKIAAGAITAAKTNIAALNSTTGDLNSDVVGSLQIAANAVTAAKTSIAAISNTTGNLVDNSVGNTQISNDAVTSEKIIANAIVAGKIAADAVTADTIASNAITSEKIFAGSITTDKIGANAITANKIAASTITGDKIAATTITGDNIAALTIGAGQIAASAITAVKIEAGAITADKILADAVTADKILAGSVTTLKLDTSAVTADKIAANTITADKISSSTVLTQALRVGTAGSLPAISGTTMTGTGAYLYADGRMVVGNSTKNMVFDSTGLYINGISTATIGGYSVGNPMPSSPGSLYPNGYLDSFVITKAGYVQITVIGEIFFASNTTAYPNVYAPITVSLRTITGGTLPGDATGVVDTFRYRVVAPIVKPDFGAATNRLQIPLVWNRVANLPIGTYAVFVCGEAFFNDVDGNLGYTVPVVDRQFNGRMNIFQAMI